MKILFATFLLLLFSNIFAQRTGETVFNVKDTITLSHSIPIFNRSGTIPYEYSVNEGNLLVQPNILKGGYRYMINNIDDTTNKVTLQPLNFKVYNFAKIQRRIKRKNFLTNRIVDKSITSLLYNDKTFEVKKQDFINSATNKKNRVLPDRLTIGILTLPFKFRPQGDKSFDSDFNLNSTLGVRFWTLGGGHLYGQIGAGIGGVELNTINAKGIGEDATINANALSMLTGLMIQYKKVQAGIYLGTDFINNQTYYQWKYQGKSWIAFGVGYQLFNVGSGDERQIQKE